MDQPPLIDYTALAASAVATAAGCFNCDKIWGNANGYPRDNALDHARTEKHMVWIEGKIPEPK